MPNLRGRPPWRSGKNCSPIMTAKEGGLKQDMPLPKHAGSLAAVRMG